MPDTEPVAAASISKITFVVCIPKDRLKSATRLLVSLDSYRLRRAPGGVVRPASMARIGLHLPPFAFARSCDRTLRMTLRDHIAAVLRPACGQISGPASA